MRRLKDAETENAQLKGTVADLQKALVRFKEDARMARQHVLESRKLEPGAPSFGDTVPRRSSTASSAPDSESDPLVVSTLTKQCEALERKVRVAEQSKHSAEADRRRLAELDASKQRAVDQEAANVALGASLKSCQADLHRRAVEMKTLQHRLANCELSLSRYVCGWAGGFRRV